MYIKNKNRKHFKNGFIYFLCLFTAVTVYSSTPYKIYTGGAKGMDIRIIQQKRDKFVHAELMIFYNQADINPAITELTYLNLLDPYVNGTGSGLLNHLSKLGNDFQVESRPDYLLIKVNFLPNRVATFSQFVKNLFSFKGFSLKKFNISVKDYWKIFYKRQDWKKQTASQIAYSKLFPGHLLGNTLITPEKFKNINLAQIRSFYQRTFVPENAILVMKGDVEPPLVVGSLNRVIKAHKPQEDSVPQKETKLNLSRQKEVFIVDVKNATSPLVVCFEAIPPMSKAEHIPYRAINDILFGQHIGRLSQSLLFNDIKISLQETEIINHRELSIIRNSVILSYYRDIDKFLSSMENEKKKLRTRKIDRKEYLNVKNYVNGKIKVKSRKFESDVEFERDQALFEKKKDQVFLKQPLFNAQFLTLENLNSVAGKLKKCVIIIVGNADMIRRNSSVVTLQVNQEKK